MSLAECMAELAAAGSAQTRKTYARHGAAEPMFGVSFATLKVLLKRIKVDHELACALWDTGNFDARNLAFKIADPQRMAPALLDRWARESASMPMCDGYVAMLAAEGPHGVEKADAWLASGDSAERQAGWSLAGQLAMRNETLDDAWFLRRLGELEQGIHAAPNEERKAMNRALIALGGRNAPLREAGTSRGAGGYGRSIGRSYHSRAPAPAAGGAAFTI
jgi:3-methyladenine DNA glycosylase AlkD